ncbi:MAG: TetR/AcrR family transcriptional regulator [Eggerthellaceae bacterium]|nr:TetR/AcrR family transcriptional regulator [Eggerthellaceae bacterium]MDR2715300.1 TetR/AcrR family transcriptional regulator [Coriobacteriaceae bacterium]
MGIAISPHYRAPLCYTVRTICFIRFVLSIGGDNLDSFFKLRAEKQEHIIDAALAVFGRNGYRKASVADIAAEAGIAKGMVMYYFGSKKNLYLFLAGHCEKILLEAVEEGVDKNVTDFFDKIRIATEVKVSMMKKHPAILLFLAKFYYETDSEVAEILEEFSKKGGGARDRILLDGTDISKFKDGVDPKLLEKFFLWASEGFVNSFGSHMGVDDIDPFVDEFYALIDVMRKHFYKVEQGTV